MERFDILGVVKSKPIRINTKNKNGTYCIYKKILLKTSAKTGDKCKPLFKYKALIIIYLIN
jgi:hypothetical protein